MYPLIDFILQHDGLNIYREKYVELGQFQEFEIAFIWHSSGVWRRIYKARYKGYGAAPSNIEESFVAMSELVKEIETLVFQDNGKMSTPWLFRVRNRDDGWLWEDVTDIVSSLLYLS